MDHQLLLMPRDHQKSALVAYMVAWELTKDPSATFLYISATATLAQKQLYFIKNILGSKIYQRYWPDMINPEEGKREKWTETEISVDHPKRKEEGVRDSSIFTAGLTTTITGLHFNYAVLDDIVIKENAYTNDGRRKVAEQYSLLASIESAGAKEWTVGTRYHAKDLYSTISEMEEDVYNEDDELIGTELIYEVFQREVEDKGDGTGEFLWPRQRRKDGKWFGFDIKVLAKKRGKYLDRTQYYAQYYNDPNDPENLRITPDKFQYYDKKHLEQRGGSWYFKDSKLNVVAAIDFAFSTKSKADDTAIAVIGIDSFNNIYVLDIDRFKTDKISIYFQHIKDMHNTWGFRLMRAETSVGQKAIVKELKETYIKENGMALRVDEFSPNRHMGSKKERMAATLEPRYDNMAMWHYRGGWCQTLEEQVSMENPVHDDIKDALTAAIDIAVAPNARSNRTKIRKSNVVSHPRFGGVRFN